MDLIARKQRPFFPRHAQQEPAATKTGLVGECAHGFHQGLADLARGLGLDALVLIQQIEPLQQLLCRHVVTSRSRLRMRASTSASSASITSNGRGGVYSKKTRLKLIS